MRPEEFTKLKASVDTSQIFLVFMALVGDCERTAAALDLDPKFVGELAVREGWTEKIKRVSVMSKSGKPGDYERAVNRALNFTQAHQLRRQLDRLLMECANMTSEELLDRACVRTRDGGQQLSAKFLVDMASCAEACHRMTYAALADTCGERQDRAESGDGSHATDIHSAIIAALSEPNKGRDAKVLLLEETSQKVQALVSSPSEARERRAEQS